ncbi:RsmB/NOP family class I SAM-dependent RNA methyltransferase [Bauldia sp.]|uniref:RsmB/NOP family class I SAM-dependent RNA methyltransferase n=1 Tax=Bauldia sp. TaxID=2575872 RepID=UPI003BAB8AEE
MNRTERREALGIAPRRVAVALLSAVLDQGRPLDSLWDADEGRASFGRLDERDRRFARAIVTTALRRHGTIAAILAGLIAKPPKKAGSFDRVLEVAAAQILFMDTADHAAVSIAVDLVGQDRAARRYKGLANAVLRRIVRDRPALLAAIDTPVADTPDWLWERWTRTYGIPIAGAIAEAQRLEPALDLSVKADPDTWAERLDGVVLPTGTVRLATGGAITTLPGYGEGAWWVQDAAAALPALVLGDVADMRVADLCAAPGGKTAALAARGASVTAVDISSARLERLAANLDRLQLSAEIVAADVLSWEPAAPFDAVLLDAPCTATGTIRRHPDVAWLKRPGDIATLAGLQAQMMECAIRWVKPGGTLVYCTCSLEPEEGEARIAALSDRTDVAPLPINPAEIGGLQEVVTDSGTIRSLPCHLRQADPRLSGLDGFYVARLRVN